MIWTNYHVSLASLCSLLRDVQLIDMIHLYQLIGLSNKCALVENGDTVHTIEEMK